MPAYWKIAHGIFLGNPLLKEGKLCCRGSVLWFGYEVLGRGQKPLDACNTDSMLFLLVGCLGWFGVYNLISVLHNVSAGVMRKWSHAA